VLGFRISHRGNRYLTPRSALSLSLSLSLTRMAATRSLHYVQIKDIVFNRAGHRQLRTERQVSPREDNSGLLLAASLGCQVLVLPSVNGTRNAEIKMYTGCPVSERMLENSNRRPIPGRFRAPGDKTRSGIKLT